MGFLIELKQSVRKELDALDDVVFSRIDGKIVELAGNPRPAGFKKLKGYRDLWRIRIGDYRVIYVIDNASRPVTIMHVAHRREVYE